MGQIAEDLCFRWLGVAGIELRASEVLTIDPFFTRPPLWALDMGRWSPREDLVRSVLPRCDRVLVTHAHFDHLMDVPAVAAQTGATVYGSENTCRLLALCGVPDEQIVRVMPGDILALGPWSVRVLQGEHPSVPGFGPGRLREGLHPPLRLRDYVMDACYSYAIETEQARVLCWAGGPSVMAPAPMDLLFARTDLNAAGLAQLLQVTRPRLVVPIHWDNLFRPLTKDPSHPARPFWEPPRRAWPPLRRAAPQAFCRAVESLWPDATALVPEPLREYNLAAFTGSPFGQ